RINPAAKPPAMDVTVLEGALKGTILLGIYEIDGDTHRLCLGQDGVARPKEFISRPNSGHTLTVFKRSPPPAPKPEGSVGVIVPLWERPAEDLLAADLGVAPLAVLGRLPADVSLEDGLTAVAQRLAERLIKEAPPERVKKLLTDALLLTGLRVRRDVAVRIVRGVRVMEESDTYLMILDQGQEKASRDAVLAVGEEKFGLPDEAVKTQLNLITDLDRLRRMIRRAAKAANWQEILDTP